ncbi:MAG: DUF3667 domain-containing protein [Planctomycetota bacterium]|nr:MAG: DUF3667 domain-containing protein [Planctomycetota bacterium]
MSAPAPCPNCGTEPIGAYCHACGQQQQVEHTLFTVLGKTASDIGHLDQVLLRTLVDLLRRPGDLVADVLRGKTKPYAKPIATLVLVASTQFLIMRLTGYTEAIAILQAQRDQGIAASLQQRINEMMLEWGQYVGLFALPFASFSSWHIDGRRRPYGHWLVFYAYAVAGTSVIGILVALPFIGHPRMYAGAMVAQMPLMVAYFAWAARRAFGIGWLRAIFGVAAPWFFAIIMMSFVLLIIGLVVLLIVSPA